MSQVDLKAFLTPKEIVKQSDPIKNLLLITALGASTGAFFGGVKSNYEELPLYIEGKRTQYAISKTIGNVTSSMLGYGSCAAIFGATTALFQIYRDKDDWVNTALGGAAGGAALGFWKVGPLYLLIGGMVGGILGGLIKANQGVTISSLVFLRDLTYRKKVVSDYDNYLEEQRVQDPDKFWREKIARRKEKLDNILSGVEKHYNISLDRGTSD
eukprot:TRINITY_DN13707_c0_g1_i1.p1 TRINITY_DN13707_c0_g1~~TRINITY_DN13707_c0_g1_i1.p1  ORF type:complete len:213 (+),score=33.06 TRINITY_DN13707_c0_g1_i1:32-670(+)